MKKYLLIAFACAIIAGGALISMGQTAQANSGTSYPITGYAWSSNIGWIDFNCADLRTCSTSNAAVMNSSGYLLGYAWSSNIGWIKFGGLSGMPGGSTQQAYADYPYTGNVSGWARACGGTINADCASATRTDGWDGWISLSGSNYGVQLNTTTGALTNFAWGGDVVGWINFNPSIPGNPAPGQPGGPTDVGLGGGPSLTVSCSPSAGYTSSITAGSYAGYTATVFGSGSTGPYTFDFNWGDASSDDIFSVSVGSGRDTHKYTSAGIYTLGVKVTDGTTPVALTGTNSGCATITVTNPTTSFQLNAGPAFTPVHDQTHPLTVKQGHSFNLIRNISIPSGYDTCSAYVDSGNWSWSSQVISYNDGVRSFLDPVIDTSNNNTGLYKFSMQCSNSSNDPSYPQENASTYVKVTSVSEGEI